MPHPVPISDDDASRLEPLLAFAPSVDARFEAETRRFRVRQLRRTIVWGLVFYNGCNFTALHPAFVLRSLVITPIGLLIAWQSAFLSPLVRESAVLFGMGALAAVPAYRLWGADPLYTSYLTGQLTLAMVFGTMVLAMRFRQSLIFVAAILAASLPSYCLKHTLPPGLAQGLFVQLTMAASFVLWGNYRRERGLRLGYLSTLRASLLSANLQVDKAALERLSSVDTLTGIANRRRLSERLAAWCADGANHDRPLAVVMVDVDHFKQYNDAHGHPAGDVCLTRITQAMAGCLRDDHDLLARYGGEEFAVLLPGAVAAEGSAVAQRLCAAVAALGLPHGRRDDGMATVTISAGVASATVNGRRRARAVFEAADAALYSAKRRGRNQHAVVVPTEPPSFAVPSDLAPLPTDGW